MRLEKKTLRCVSWYSKRCIIEELFRVMKTKGFSVESAQLVCGSLLKKLTVIAMIAAVKTVTLKLSLKLKCQI